MTRFSYGIFSAFFRIHHPRSNSWISWGKKKINLDSPIAASYRPIQPSGLLSEVWKNPTLKSFKNSNFYQCAIYGIKDYSAYLLLVQSAAAGVCSCSRQPILWSKLCSGHVYSIDTWYASATLSHIDDLATLLRSESTLLTNRMLLICFATLPQFFIVITFL